MLKKRFAVINRLSKETDIKIKLNLDGQGKFNIKTGLHFFDHMLEQLAKHGNFDLDIFCQGDLQVDEHHTIEDIGLVLGEAFKKALGDKKGIERYAFERILPMEESLAFVTLDFSGRGLLVFKAKFQREKIGDFPTEMLEHFLASFCQTAGLNMHLTIEGKNTHHQIEAAFKSLAKCLKDAVKRTGQDLPSTKGLL